jgi:MFS family permease
VVVLLASMAAPINYYKVPPLMPLLMSAFHLTGGKAGMLMSIFAVVGILLSIPAGFILTRLGYRATGLLGVAWIAAGAGLDEISNNLDLETREHAIQVLKAYPGAMIVISHDEDLLGQIGVKCLYEIKEGTLVPDYHF